jgi:hypothetical protein
MKRLALILLLPAVLLALEPVNLIKDHSFEKDSELWQVYAGGDGNQDSAVASRHDPEKAYTGFCSASSDTRKLPGDYWVFYDDSAMLMQGFCCNKLVSDIDTLTISYSIIPVEDNFFRSAAIFIAVYLNAGNSIAGYYHKGPTLQDPTPIPPRRYIGVNDLPSDTNWCTFSWNLRADLLNAGISSSAPLDSFLIMGWGIYWPPWKGQKIFWDDIRLMGYADYDVGVKEILSGDSLRQGHPYTPEARIKNFGREPTDTFLVIAEIEDSSAIVYIDTLSWSLEPDTEDTVTFAEFTPNYGPYTLRVRTVMEPDESDEDDQMSKDMYCSFCEDSPGFPGISMEIKNSITKDVLRITYVLPAGQLGIISIYDASGRLHDRVHVRGVSETRIPAALPRGIYFIRLNAGEVSVTRKAVILH